MHGESTLTNPAKKAAIGKKLENISSCLCFP